MAGRFTIKIDSEDGCQAVVRVETAEGTPRITQLTPLSQHTASDLMANIDFDLLIRAVHPAGEDPARPVRPGRRRWPPALTCIPRRN